MKCELLAEENPALMLDFIDDENTKYDEDVLKAFLDEKNEKQSRKILFSEIYASLPFL